MVIHELDGAPSPKFQRALETFESTFKVPFDPGRTFHLDYGADRTAFVRTLGESKCLMAEENGVVQGFFEIVVVNMLRPDGGERRAAYIADIKLLPEARKKVATARLIQRGIAWGMTKTDLGFTVTMDETPIKPPSYTGRAGIPALSEVARIAIVRLQVAPGANVLREDVRFPVSRAEGEALFKRLAFGRYAFLGGSPEKRSIVEPTWMVHPSNLACGRFEDRRKVRKLIADDGTELQPAYFSCFAFQDKLAALELLAAALRRAAALGFRALRFCLPPGDLTKIERGLNRGMVQLSTGGIFANDALATRAPWLLSAVEI